MSKGIGIGVLGLGLLGLGWWAHGHHGPRIQDHVRQLAETAVASSIHGAAVTVSGRDIHLTGIADSKAEAEALMAALDGLPARRVVTQDLTVLETVSPFTLSVTKTTAGLTATGHVPTEALRADLATTLGEGAAALTLASGAPQGWGDLAAAGLAALAPLSEGQLTLTDDQLTLTGTAATPVEAEAVKVVLARLPTGAATTELTLLDDGTPAAWTLDYTATTGATAAGKLPKGLDLAAVAAATGLPSIGGSPTTALMGAPADAGIFAGLKDWMGQIETLTYALAPAGQSLRLGVQGGVDADALTSALTANLPDVALTVETVTSTGENGARRNNAATGADERFMGGYWLAVPDIDLGLQGCQTAAEEVLTKGTITFVTGSDQLDASALAIINDLAAVMAPCAEEAGLKAVIGGHTDNVGDQVSNLGLSQRRATAVRREMMDRGVPAASLKALGFGDAQPIADNGTDAGRAANRRTTIQWSE
ncbi:MAG: OmpA family protein [Paracoccaceae bacterium]